MKVSIKKGLSYGATSGVITSLGLLIGLYSTGSPRAIILAGILTIAFADSFSDGLGIHISEESENHHTQREIWEATTSTILSKMILGLSFTVPVIIFQINTAVFVNIIWGAVILSVLSYRIAKQNNDNPALVLTEHLGIALLVVAGSYLLGNYISSVFK